MFDSKTERYTLLLVILTLSAMGLSLYSNCGSCSNRTSKQLYHVFLSSTIISAFVIVALFAYENKDFITR